jgi:hypothetical protein
MNNRRLSPKRSLTFGLLVSALLLSLLVVQGTQVWADTPTQLTSTVTTSHFSVSLVFPTSASPGQSEQILATTTATSSASIISFSIDISSYVNGQPVKLASQTVSESTTVQTGAEWQTLLTVNIPPDAQAGPLIGTVTEVWQNPNYYSSYYSTPYYYTYYYYSMPYPPNYPNYNTYQYQHDEPQGNYQNSNTHQYQHNVPQGSYQSSNTHPYQSYRYPNGFTGTQTPPQNHQQTQPQTNHPSYFNHPSYPYRPTYYPGSNYYEPYYVITYYPTYTSDYSVQVTSQQTVALTYVT